MKVTKADTGVIPNLAGLPPDERTRLEDQITERAFTLWRRKGHAHRNALNALLQAEREVLAGKQRQPEPVFNPLKSPIKAA